MLTDMLLTMNLILPDERDAKQNTPLHYVVRVLDNILNFRSTSYEEDRERLTETLCTMLRDHGRTALDYPEEKPEEQTRGKRFTRQRAIDAILAAEGVAPDDYYYYRAYINGEFKMDITMVSIQKHVKCLVTG